MIQVNEQNIHQVIQGFEIRLNSVAERIQVFEDSLHFLDNGDIVSAGKSLIGYYLLMANEELAMIRQQVSELKDIQAKLKSNIIVPGGPLAPNSVLR